MRVSYQQLDIDSDVVRPIVRFTLGGSDIQLDGLLDTGAINTIVDVALGEAAGISMTGPDELLPFGRGLRVIRQSDVRLTIGEHQLVGDICFATEWRAPYQLLGFSTVLSQLVLTFDGPSREVEI